MPWRTLSLPCVEPTSFTKSIMSLSLVIVTFGIFLVPCQAQNTAPVLNLNIALKRGNVSLVLLEDTPVLSLLGLLEVVDNDKGPAGKVKCRSESNYVGLAVMSPDYYKVQLENHLDREVLDIVDVVFLCTDNGSPPLSNTATFSLEVKDANDNDPKFTQGVYTFTLIENYNESSVVGVVRAMDRDAGENAIVSYFLEDENGEVPSSFEINEANGVITCTSAFDREMTEEIVLYAYAEDHGIPPLHDQAEIRVKILDVNDNRPVIVSSQFSIEENLEPMSHMGTLRAFDKDSGLNGDIEFNLDIGEDDLFLPPFIVDSDGDIYAAVPLDRERRDQYIIQVSATDFGAPPLSVTANITITVLDANDNRPNIISPKEIDDFDLSINSSESITIDWYSPEDDKIVYTVIASDKDIRENGRIFYSIDSINSQPIDDDSLFAIGKDTGHVFLRRPIRKDDDPVQVLSFFVFDGGNPPLNATTSLNVTLDVDFMALTTPSPTEPGMSQNKGPGGSADIVNIGLVKFLYLFGSFYFWLNIFN